MRGGRRGGSGTMGRLAPRDPRGDESLGKREGVADMGVLSMVLGPSGSGKSTSLLKLGNVGVEVFGCTGKRLPFRAPLNMRKRASYRMIYDALRRNESRCYVIDDSTYLMQLDNFRHAQEKGFDKFVTMAVSFETLLEAAMATSDDTTVYFMHHPQFAENGSAKPQTIGKMLDSQLCVEGLFDIILEAGVEDSRHVFWTNEHGIAKTPLNMFEDRVIDNDLDLVDRTIRGFWGMEDLRPTRGGATRAHKPQTECVPG
jgi:hypothetical protein